MISVVPTQSTKRPPCDNVQGESSKAQKTNQGSKPTGGGGKSNNPNPSQSSKPTQGDSSTDHPDNKCSGCGNKPNWQESQNLPICTKAKCTFATANHPDYNPSPSWASSEVANVYAKHIRNRKGQPVHSLTMNKKLLRDNFNNIVYPVRTVNINEVSKIIYSIHNILNLNSSNDSCNNFSTSASSENHTLPETPSIEEQLEMGNSSYEVKKNDKVQVVNNNISEFKLDPTSKVDQVAITNNNNNQSSKSKVNNTQTNTKVSHKQHNVLQIEDNPLLLSTNVRDATEVSRYI